MLKPEELTDRSTDQTMKMFAGPDPDEYSKCVHCGFCLEVCPTYQQLSDENHSPRGRVFLIKQVAEGTLPLEAAEDPVFACLDCRACETVCPSGVPVGHLIEMSRGQIHDVRTQAQKQSRRERWMLRGLFSHPRRLRLAGGLLRFYQLSGLRRAARAVGALKLLPRHLQEIEAGLPTVPSRRSDFSLPLPVPAPSDHRSTQPVRVGLLTGCVMDVLFADVNDATVRVIARNHMTVVVPKGQVCCGALHVHAGDREEAQALARRNIDEFLGSQVDFVVTNSAGCGAAMKEYGDLLRDDPGYREKAQAFSAVVRDISEILVEQGFDAPTGRLDRQVTYHDACHLCHAQRIREQPRQLLTAIEGVDLIEMPDSERCCGSAGVYNLTHPDMARQLLERKITDIPEQASAVVMGNPGCMIQIRAGLAAHGRSTTVLHTVQLLDMAYQAEMAEAQASSAPKR